MPHSISRFCRNWCSAFSGSGTSEQQPRRQFQQQQEVRRPKPPGGASGSQKWGFGQSGRTLTRSATTENTGPSPAFGPAAGTELIFSKARSLYAQKLRQFPNENFGIYGPEPRRQPEQTDQHVRKRSVWPPTSAASRTTSKQALSLYVQPACRRVVEIRQSEPLGHIHLGIGRMAHQRRKNSCKASKSWLDNPQTAHQLRSDG